MDNMRPAPNSANPPAYSRFTRAYRSNLRPAVLIITSFTALYGLIAAAAVIRSRESDSTPSNLKIVYLIFGILYLIGAAVEIFGVGATWKSSIKLVKTFLYSHIAVVLFIIGVEVARLIVHFTAKSSIIAACIAKETADEGGNVSQTVAATISEYCNDRWSSRTYYNVGLLIFTLLLGAFFTSIIASYLHQLINPQILRQQIPQEAASAQYAYPLQAYPPQPYGQPMTGFAPAPPQYAGNYGGAPAYESNGYQTGPEKDENPFRDGGVQREMTTEERERWEHERNQANESTDTVTLEPRRDNERNV